MVFICIQPLIVNNLKSHLVLQVYIAQLVYRSGLLLGHSTTRISSDLPFTLFLVFVLLELNFYYVSCLCWSETTPHHDDATTVSHHYEDTGEIKIPVEKRVFVECVFLQVLPKDSQLLHSYCSPWPACQFR